MTYFRERNNIQTEYSGHQSLSDGLRGRLTTITSNHSGSYLGTGQDSFLFIQRFS